MSDFILASASPRRVDLLKQIGMCFIQLPAAIDESRHPQEHPQDYVLRMAGNKARHVWNLLQSQVRDRDAVLLPVLGADTTVVLSERIFTKPRNKADAVDTLLALSGRRHQVLSAVAVCGSEGLQSLLSETWVSFKELSPVQCERYWESGEPHDKAGAYAIQGLGAVFVKSIQGSYSGVVGLPLVETVELLSRYDITYWNKP